MIMHTDNLESVKQFGLRHGYKVCTAVRYLGGFIRDHESKRDWEKVRTSRWQWIIHTIRKMAGGYLQSSYTALLCEIQL